MEVDAGALRRNFRAVRASVGPSVGIVPMVKADAYGVGVREAVRALDAHEPWGYGVASVAEGIELRRLTERPVVVFTPIAPGELPAAIDADLRITVSDEATLVALGRAATDGASARFHAEIDSGMGRAGLDPRGIDSWGPALQAALAGGAVWEGVFTHLHSADDSPDTVDPQIALFESTLARLAPGPDVLRHALNSAGCFVRPGYAFQLVRPGIFLYGGRPGMESPEPDAVVSLRARVIRVKEARPGDTLGYGSTHVAERAERWATVAVGYGDGLPRALSNKGWGVVGGRRVPIIGRISMDVTVVDITGLPSVRPGQVVTFLGCDGQERVTLGEMADLAGTIGYEVLTGFTPRLPRIWELPVGP